MKGLLEQFEIRPSDIRTFPFSDDDVVGLSPDSFMRKETNRVVFSLMPHLDLLYGMFRPTHAVVLCLFDGVRTIRDIAAIIADVHGCPFDEALLFLKKTMEITAKDYAAFVKIDHPGRRFKKFDYRDYALPGTGFDGASRLEAPLTLQLQVTDRCHTDCTYCYAEHPGIPFEHFLTLKQIEAMLDEAQRLGVGQMNLCGGDPMCHPDIAEITRMCIDRGITTDISTSAYVSPDLARRMAATGIDWLQVSIDSHIPEIADRLYGVKGHHARVCETIRNFKEAGVYTRTNSIITRHNVDDIAGLVRFIHNLGIDNMKIAPSIRSYFRDNSADMLTFEQQHALAQQVAELAREYQPRGLAVNYASSTDHSRLTQAEKDVYLENQPDCGGGRTSLIIGPDGRVRLCEQAPMTDEFVVGDLRHQTIKEVWDGEPLLRFIRPKREAFGDYPCATCDTFEMCMHKKGQCFVDALKAYGSAWAPNPKCGYAPPSTVRLN